MIRRAKISEISEILNLTRACAVNMVNNGIYQWNEHYPSKKAFENDIERSELFVLEKNHEIVGTIAITTLMDKEYHRIIPDYDEYRKRKINGMNK